MSHVATFALVPLAVLLGSAAIRAQQRQAFAEVAVAVQQQLEQSVAELAALRERLAAEKLPLTRQLAEAEAELSRTRAEYQQETKTLDARALDLGRLRDEVKARQAESAYLANLLGDYQRNFEAALHVAELQRHRAVLDAARQARENRMLAPHRVFAVQQALLSAALTRLEDALGGARFDGTAVDPAGLVQRGTFVLIGPAAVFRSADGAVIGSAEQRLGSLEPAVVPLPDPALTEAAGHLVAAGHGEFPLDPTLGQAHKIAATSETPWQHVLRGGPVMWPILALAAAALFVALVKWGTLLLVRMPAPRQVQTLLAAAARRDHAAARQAAQGLRGPAGRMLAAGVAHLDEPRELVEEVMYETVLATRLRLGGWLPFIAITASSAPLLGLLGTVTGIMNTFTLMTTFGTGDPKTLSSGISEALITTEYGLYVAIPSLLLYALLSRKVRRVVDGMEQCAVALVNQLGKPPAGGDAAPGEPGLALA